MQACIIAYRHKSVIVIVKLILEQMKLKGGQKHLGAFSEPRISRIVLSLVILGLHFILRGRNKPRHILPRPNSPFFPKYLKRAPNISINIVTQPNKNMGIIFDNSIPYRLNINTIPSIISTTTKNKLRLHLFAKKIGMIGLFILIYYHHELLYLIISPLFNETICDHFYNSKGDYNIPPSTWTIILNPMALKMPKHSP